MSEQNATGLNLDDLAEEAREADAEGAAKGAKTGEYMPAGGAHAPDAAGALEDAKLIIAGVAKGVEAIWGVNYGPETQAEGAKRLAPLLAKYGGSFGFGKWKDEIEAGLFFGGVAFGTWQAVRAARQVQPEQPKPEGGKK